MKKRCKSTYRARHGIIRCDLREGHNGNHSWVSWFWFLNLGRYKWDDSTQINEKSIS